MQQFRILVAFGLILIMTGRFHLKGQDLGISKITYPAENQYVHLQYTYEVVFNMVNYDVNPVPKGTLINFDVLFDKVLFQSYNLTLNNAPINAGDSLTITIPPLTISTAKPTIELCVVVRLGSDINHQNDTSCNVLYFTIDNNVDLQPKLVDIVLPVRDSILVINENILKMEGYLLNSGTVTLPKDYEITIQYTMYGIKKTIKSKTAKSVAPNDNFIMIIIGTPPVQSTPGSFDICMTVLNVDDVNSSNNEHCQTFYVKDFTGMADSDPDKFRTTISNNELTVFFQELADPVTMSLYNSLGQKVYSSLVQRGNTKQSVTLDAFTSGLYIIDIADMKASHLYTSKVYIR